MNERFLAYAIGLALACFATGAAAGPVIIDGTDANDHGSVSGTTNLGGWEYMQRALENLAAARLAANPAAMKVVVDLGTTPAGAGVTARNAIDSAFNNSSLPGAGWTLSHVDGAAIAGFLATLSPTTTGILYIPTAGHAVGDLLAAELAAINAAAAQINSYVSGTGDPTQGGALFAMGETQLGATPEFGWLSALLPGITFTDQGVGGIGTNITLTAAGMAAFSGLTDADLVNADPWHNWFGGNLGGLSVLGVANDNAGVSRPVIIGGGAGTVIQCGVPGAPPCPAPEPGALPLLGIALLALGLAVLRRRAA